MTVKSEAVLLAHQDRFGQPGKLFRAPARVNLIGEHTDYTGGLVMPMAIDFHTVAVIGPRHDDRMMFYSENYKEETVVEKNDLKLGRRGHWSDYPAGVAWSLQMEGIEFGGFNMTLAGDVPLGAGLSSSASVEVAVAMAIQDFAGTTLPLEEGCDALPAGGERICRSEERNHGPVCGRRGRGAPRDDAGYTLAQIRSSAASR